jgi:hypothetical protein
VSVLDHLEPLDRALVAKGFPTISAWWLTALTFFYASAKRQLVLRVGRRGGKSSTLCRIAVLEALYGQHVIPPGDVGVVAIVSVSRDEANQRLRTVKAILDALGVKWRPIEGGIEIESRPVVFKTYAASISGVSGFTCICAICDEAAKWKDSDSGANPAREVLASLRPTMAGQPNARIFLSSSPMGKQDAHAVAFDLGDTAFQSTAAAQTWVARPTLTEAECRALEPDPDTFQREYGVVPFDGTTSSMFTEAAILSVTRKGPAHLPSERGAYLAATDPASRSNGWTLAIARAREIGDNLFTIEVVRCCEWRAPRGGALDSDATLGEIAGVLGEYGITELWSDQWSFDSLSALAARHGLELRQEASTQAGKVQSFEALKRRIADRTLEIPDDPVVRSDLLGVRKWISRGGAFSIELERQGGRHSDHAASVALVVKKCSEDAGGVPNWVRSMQNWRHAMNGTTPAPVVAPPRPQDFVFDMALAQDTSLDAIFGGRTKTKTTTAELVVDGSPISGMYEAHGAGLRFSPKERATWTRTGPTTFSAEATPPFRDAVSTHRSANSS